jgi:hypothetical protein
VSTNQGDSKVVVCSGGARSLPFPNMSNLEVRHLPIPSLSIVACQVAMEVSRGALRYVFLPATVLNETL